MTFDNENDSAARGTVPEAFFPRWRGGDYFFQKIVKSDKTWKNKTEKTDVFTHQVKKIKTRVVFSSGVVSVLDGKSLKFCQNVTYIESCINQPYLLNYQLFCTKVNEVVKEYLETVGANANIPKIRWRLQALN